MKRFFILILALCFSLSAFAGCVETGEKPKEDYLLESEISIDPEYTRYDIAFSNGRKTEGYGCQVDTHIFKESNGNYYSEEDFEEWLARIDDMGLQSIRTQVFPEWYERGNDNGNYDLFDYESPNVDMESIEMQQLYRLLDLCEERDIKVDLSFYGCNRIFASQDGKISGSWLANTYTGNWITAPKTEDENGNSFAGNEEYAESVSALLSYLLDVKQYTCIYEFSLFPEPNLSFLDPQGKSNDNAYAAFCKVVYEKLKADGLWGRVLFSGPGDCANDPARYENYTKLLAGVYQKNTSSVYRFNDTSTNAEMYEYAKTLVDICDREGITWGVCESGTDRYIDPANQSDIDTYERALFLARQMIQFTNAGCTNIKYWVLNDVWYDGYIMRLGLWKLADDRFFAEARPQFYSWSLITKFAAFGSDIYPVTSSDEDVCMVAFKLPGGEWSYLIANNSAYTRKISIVNRWNSAQTTFDVYELSGSTVPNTNRVLTSQKSETAENCVVSLTLRANSFTVLSNLR